MGEKQVNIQTYDSKDVRLLCGLLPCAFCVVTYDKNFSFVMMNQHMCDLFGFHHEDDYDDLKSLLSIKDYQMLVDIIQTSLSKHIFDFRFTTSYILNQQRFRFAYEGMYHQSSNQIFLTITDITAYCDIELELAYIRQQHDILMAQTGHIITHYDVFTRTLYQPKAAADMLQLPQVVENVPYSIADKIIADESKQEYIKFYEEILDGKAHHEVTIRALNSSGSYSWYVMQSDLIYDEEQHPIRAIISYEDITDLQEKELAYKKWQCYFQSQQEKSIAYYEYNLTKDYFLLMEMEESTHKTIHEFHTFQELIHYTSHHIVMECDREEYCELFSRQRLLKEFCNGKREYRFEHRRMREDGSVYWALAILQLVSDLYTNDVLASVIIEDINDEKESILHLRHLSRIDPLTGLLNRSTLINEVNEILQNSTLEETHVLLMIDLDDFKQLNDTMGHKFGDQVLFDIAKELRRTVRNKDLCARLGGDEFVILLKYTTTDDTLTHRMEMLHQCINHVYGSIKTTTSIGISLYPRDGNTFDELYQKADIALYEAKRNGRNQYAVYTPLLENKR